MGSVHPDRLCVLCIAMASTRLPEREQTRLLRVFSGYAMLAAAFLLLALLCLPLGAAQSCEAHQPDLLPACAFVYEQAGDEVFVPAGETQASMLATSGIAGSIGLLAQASASCSAAALALLCPQVWSHCLPISAGTAAPTNRSLCRNVCEEVFTACAPEIKALGQLVASLLPPSALSARYLHCHCGWQHHTGDVLVLTGRRTQRNRCDLSRATREASRGLSAALPL